MYNLERDAHGHACAISKDGQWLIHLQPGTMLTEYNIEMIVRELNAGQGQKELAQAREEIERMRAALVEAEFAQYRATFQDAKDYDYSRAIAAYGVIKEALSACRESCPKEDKL